MKTNTKKGFTLIELMVAMGVIAVLAGMSFVAVGIVQRSVRDTQRRDVATSINLAITEYQNSNGTYPANGQITINTAANPDEFYIAGRPTEITVEGATSNTTGLSTSSATAYCYYTNGAQYLFAVYTEGDQDWFKLGNLPDAQVSNCNSSTYRIP